MPDETMKILLELVSEADTEGMEEFAEAAGKLVEVLEMIAKSGPQAKEAVFVLQRALQVGARNFAEGATSFEDSMQLVNDMLDAAAALAKQYGVDIEGAADETKELGLAARAAGGPLQAVQSILRDISVIAAGIVLANIFMGAVRAVVDFGKRGLQVLTDFAGGTFKIAQNMQLLEFQLRGVLGGVEAAGAALAFAREQAIATPFFGVEQIAQAIRLISAFGLNYQRWFGIVANVSVATGASLGQVARAIGQIAQRSGRGIFMLRQLGINIAEAGVKFDRSGRAIGSIQEIMEKLETYLDQRFGPVLEEMSGTWISSIEGMRDAFFQFREAVGRPILDVLSRFLAGIFETIQRNQIEIRAFGTVLGESIASGVDTAIASFADLFSQIGLDDPLRWFEGGARIIAALAEGMLSGLINFVVPAITWIADTIASFLLGGSDAEQGPLARMSSGAVALIRTYFAALRSGADFGAVREIASFITTILEDGAVEARLVAARAIADISTIGAVSEAVLVRLRGLLGDLSVEVETYLGLFAQLRGATLAVAAAQNALAVAQEGVAEAQEKVARLTNQLRRFEIETADIPERFTRGRRRQLELAILAAQEEARARQESIRAAQEQIRAAQAIQAAAREQLAIQRAVLQGIADLVKAERRAGEEGEDVFVDLKNQIKDTGEEFERLRAKWEKIFQTRILPIFDRVSERFGELQALIAGLAGLEMPGLVDAKGDIVDFDEGIKTAWERGQNLAEAFSNFREALPVLVTNIQSIATSIQNIAKDFGKMRDNIQPILDLLTPILEKLGQLFAPGQLPGQGLREGGVFAGIAEGAEDAGLNFVRPILEALEVPMGPVATAAEAVWGFLGGQQTIDNVANAFVTGFLDPIIGVANDTYDLLVRRSVVKNMVKDVTKVLARMARDADLLMARFRNALVFWAQRAASEIIPLLRAIEQAFLNLASAIGAVSAAAGQPVTVPTTTTTQAIPLDIGFRRGFQEFQRGGPVLATGSARLEAGEFILNTRNASRLLRGVGDGARAVNINFMFPPGVEFAKRREIMRIARNAALEGVSEGLRRQRRIS